VLKHSGRWQEGLTLHWDAPKPRQRVFTRSHLARVFNI
jgi:hypothetical protein